MKFPKEWKCMRCGKNKDKSEIIRVGKEIYNPSGYHTFMKIFSIDLCEDCYENVLGMLLEESLPHNPTYDDYYC